jgi:hypothetical protein
MRRYSNPRKPKLPPFARSTFRLFSSLISTLSFANSSRSRFSTAPDEEGFSSCLMRPCHRAVANAPPERPAASISLRRAMLPSPPNRGFGLWIRILEVTYAFTFVTARRLAHHPMDGFVDRLHALGFLRACDPGYRALTFTLVGLPPLNTSAFSWTYEWASRSLTGGSGMPIQVRGVLVHAMSGTELSRVRTEFRLRLPEPINKSTLESRGPTWLCNHAEAVWSRSP